MVFQKTDSHSQAPVADPFIDTLADEMINEHKGNYHDLTRYAMECSALLASSRARSNELKDQAFLKGIINNWTGKNKQLRASIDLDTSDAIAVAQKSLQKLADQNLLSFEMLIALNNKINLHTAELNSEINALHSFLNRLCEDYNRHAEKMSQNVDFFHYCHTVEFETYNGIEYRNLPDIEKLFCIANDFYLKSKGEWNTRDLKFLKPILEKVKLPWDTVFSLEEICIYTIHKPQVAERLFERIDQDGLSEIEVYTSPALKGIEKISRINTIETATVQTVQNLLECNQVMLSREDIIDQMMRTYMAENKVDHYSIKNDAFRLCLELLNGLKMVDEKNRDIENKKNQISETQQETQKALIWVKAYHREKKYCHEIETQRQLVMSDSLAFSIREILVWPLHNATTLKSLGFAFNYNIDDSVRSDHEEIVSSMVKEMKELPGFNEISSFCLPSVSFDKKGARKDFDRIKTGAIIGQGEAVFLPDGTTRVMARDTMVYKRTQPEKNNESYGALYHPDDDLESVKQWVEESISKVNKFLETAKPIGSSW